MFLRIVNGDDLFQGLVEFSQCGYVSKKLYIKEKELPLMGALTGCAHPLDPPMCVYLGCIVKTLDQIITSLTRSQNMQIHLKVNK